MHTHISGFFSVLKEIIKNKKLELFLIFSSMHLSKKHGLTINEIKKFIPEARVCYIKKSACPLAQSGYYKVSKQIKSLKNKEMFSLSSLPI